MSHTVTLTGEQYDKLTEVAEHYHPDEDPALADVVEDLCDQQLEPGFEFGSQDE